MKIGKLIQQHGAFFIRDLHSEQLHGVEHVGFYRIGDYFTYEVPELVVKSVSQEYVVEDWAGNVLTNEGKFKPRHAISARVFENFDEASDALADMYGHLDDAEFDSQMGEVFIVERRHK